VAAEGERLHVSVTDSGINILEEDLTDVFELCSRPCQKKTRVGGMSLVLARRLVELHSGRIGVESGEGKDNLFWFDIPLTGPRRVGLGAME
jgi:signal transduction histidine kinase